MSQICNDETDPLRAHSSQSSHLVLDLGVKLDLDEDQAARPAACRTSNSKSKPPKELVTLHFSAARAARHAQPGRGSRRITTRLRSSRQFLTLARKQAADIKGYIPAGDAAAIGCEAHKIKGAAANLTAMRLSAAAKAMEERGKSGDLLGIGELFTQLEKELDSLEEFVKNGYCSRNATN